VFMVYSLFSFLVGSLYLGEGILPDFSNQRLANWKNYMIMPVLYIITYYNLRDRKWKYALFILLFLSFLVMNYKFYNEFRWMKHYHYMDKSRFGGSLAFLGPNEWGTFHAIYTLFIIGLFLVDKHFWRRAAYFILILGNTYSLIYSFSRGSYLGFLVGLFFIGIVRSRKVLVVLVIFLIFWKLLVPVSVVERVEGTFVEQGTRTDVVSIGESNLETAGRTELWDKALNYFFKNPLLGTGYNTYHILAGRDTHNSYLKFMAEQGIIGLFIYLWLYVLAFKSGWRLYRRADEELVKALGFGFMCAVVVSVVANFFGDRWTYLQLCGLYWVFWALVDQENNRLEMAREEMITGPSTNVVEAPTS
ncbi:O-antigen ligase family protein, partial [bacterium]|nr:O-antigen ligase family protein [bacterium]